MTATHCLLSLHPCRREISTTNVAMAATTLLLLLPIAMLTDTTSLSLSAGRGTIAMEAPPTNVRETISTNGGTWIDGRESLPMVGGNDSRRKLLSSCVMQHRLSDMTLCHLSVTRQLLLRGERFARLSIATARRRVVCELLSLCSSSDSACNAPLGS